LYFILFYFILFYFINNKNVTNSLENIPTMNKKNHLQKINFS
jgi:hypothetical protein